MSGILIFEGMQVGFLPGDLVISLGGEGDEESKSILSTAYNVLPIWLKVAKDSVKASKIASEAIVEQWNEDSMNQKQLLMSELAPSMQAFVACGISLDALYDTLRPHANISNQDIDAWRKNRTARFKQVIEVIRRIYNPDPETLGNFRGAIEYIFKNRDKAVHPSYELQRACGRPDIPVGVDWKFAVYRFENAKTCLLNTINIIAYLYENKSGDQKVDSSIEHIVNALVELNVVEKNT